MQFYTIFLEIYLLQVTILFNSSQCNTNCVQVPGSRDPDVSAAGGVLGVQHAAAEPGYQQTSPCSQHDCRHGVTVRIILSHYDDNIYPAGVDNVDLFFFCQFFFCCKLWISHTSTVKPQLKRVKVADGLFLFYETSM